MRKDSPPLKPDGALENGLRPQPISTTELFGEAREIAIDHGGEIYRLRITRQGKLILNK